MDIKVLFQSPLNRHNRYEYSLDADKIVNYKKIVNSLFQGWRSQPAQNPQSRAIRNLLIYFTISKILKGSKSSIGSHTN